MLKKIHQIFHHHYHTRYHGVYKHAKQLFIFDIILLSLTIFLIGSGLFFFFWKPGVVDMVDLSISLSDKRIKSGELVHLTTEYTNHSKLKLTNSTLAIHLPKGFIVDRERTPESVFSKNSIFNLPALEPGAKGQVEIYGRFWSEPNKEEKIIGVLSYTAEGSKKTEQKLTSFIARLPESVLQSSLTITSSTFPNQSIPFTYTLTNTSDIKLENITLTHNWTSAITTSSEKELKDFSLEPGKTKTITGKITASEKAGSYPLEIKSQLLANQHSVVQTTNSEFISVIYPQLDSKATILNHGPHVEPAQTIPIEVSWKNNSPFELSELRLKLQFTSGVVDLAATAKEYGFKTEDNTIIIDSSIRTALANGKPGGEDSFQINLKLLSTFKLASRERAVLNIQPIMEAKVANIAEQTFEQPGKQADLPIATEVKMTSEVRYFTSEGDQLGRGPLPPKVGETTKYWVFIRISNTTNAINNAEFKATLGPGVIFSGKQSVTIGQAIQYNNGTVLWNHPQIPPNSNTGLYFEVAVTPSPQQINKNLALLNNINFTATDDFVGKNIELNRGGISNILGTSDRGARLGAKVVGL